MAVTRLKRKTRKDRIKNQERKAQLKKLLFKPVIKKVDVESIKKDFANKA